MERQENAMVAPAFLFLGASVLAVFGAFVYYISRDDDEPLTMGNGGTPDPGDGDDDDVGPQTPGEISEDMWNISTSGTKVASVEQGESYTTKVVVPAAVAGAPFSVNVSPGGLHHEIGTPQISNIPHMGAVISVTFTPQGSGSIELVWPEGAIPGEEILNFYRRLDFVVSGGGGGVVA